MTYRPSRRGVAAGAATALAIGTLTVFGTSVADAAPIVRDWADGKTSFNRTISNGTPGVGETITVTTKFRRTDNVTETINWINDVNPVCLTYVPDSAKINGNPVTPVVTPTRSTTPPTGLVAVSGLTLVNAPGTNNPSYSVDYKVGANCALGSALQTGMDYSGDRGAGYYGFGGPNITAGKGNPTTTLAHAVAKINQPTTLTATVATSATGGGHAAGNPVEFYDGATKLGQGNLDAAGNATYAWTPTTVGSHALTAKFLGTTLANQSVSAVQNVTVNPADVTTTTTVTVPAAAVSDADVTLGVQVSPVPTGGTVQFKNGTTNIGSPVTLDAQGNGSLTTKFTTTGAQSITAVYAGSAQFLTSTSNPSIITVTTPPDVDTTITVTGPATGTVGTAVTLTAHVTNGPTAGGGTVQFKNGDALLGAPLPVGPNGEVTFTATELTAGPHAITAVYTGINEYQGSTSTAHTVTMSPANIDTTITVTGPTTGTVGTDVTLTAHVTNGPTAGGKVQFKDGATNLGGLVDLDAQGNASITAPLAAGNHDITAVFTGVGEYQPSTSSTHTVTMSPANVNTTITVTGPTTGTVGTAVTLTAHVTNGPAAGGKVQFKDGATNLGGLVDLDAQGNASITAPLAAGNHDITAVFTGVGEHQPSTSSTHTVTMSPANVNTTITVTGPTTGTVGTDVTLTAHVTNGPAAGGGTVQFKNGDTLLGAPLPVGPTGEVTFTATELTAGPHAITAVYTGVGEYQGSTSIAHTVTMSPANVDNTTTVTAPATATTGVEVELVANVSEASAGDTVQFMDGANKIGAPVAVVNGKATLKHIFTSAGTSNITAVHSDATDHIISTSEIRTVTVTDTETPGGGNTGGSLGNIFGSLGNIFGS